MPIRIYALAKELKIDSKVLVDFCTKAGIQGKGSALASLEDDEVVKLKAYMEGGAAKRPSAPAPLVSTASVLSAPVAPTATLPPPPPPPRPSPIRSRVGSAATAAPSPGDGGVALAPPPPQPAARTARDGRQREGDDHER